MAANGQDAVVQPSSPSHLHSLQDRSEHEMDGDPMDVDSVDLDYYSISDDGFGKALASARHGQDTLGDDYLVVPPRPRPVQDNQPASRQARQHYRHSSTPELDRRSSRPISQLFGFRSAAPARSSPPTRSSDPKRNVLSKLFGSLLRRKGKTPRRFTPSQGGNRDSTWRSSSAVELDENSICVICDARPLSYQQVYPVCGDLCAAELETVMNLPDEPSRDSGSTQQIRRRSTDHPALTETSDSLPRMPEPTIKGLKKSASDSSGFKTTHKRLPSLSNLPAKVELCVICHERPQSQDVNQCYPVCGYTCAGKLQAILNLPDGTPRESPRQEIDQSSSHQPVLSRTSSSPALVAGPSRLRSNNPFAKELENERRAQRRSASETSLAVETRMVYKERRQPQTSTYPKAYGETSSHKLEDLDARPHQSSRYSAPIQQTEKRSREGRSNPTSVSLNPPFAPAQQIEKWSRSVAQSSRAGGSDPTRVPLIPPFVKDLERERPIRREFAPSSFQPRGEHSTPTRARPPLKDPCVICHIAPCYNKIYVTCGQECAEKLCKGGGDPQMCSYCRRRPRRSEYNQCGETCKTAARFACLLCMSRPKYKAYSLCGNMCKRISHDGTLLVLEVPVGHVTYDMVLNKFNAAWKYGPRPTITKVYKINESRTFLEPYNQYNKRFGNEVFRYHGTSRKCTLGSRGNTTLCNDLTCSLCSILKTSFKTSLANPAGAFGAGVYTSSAANKAYSYSNNGKGAMILTKVILGKSYVVKKFAEVSTCPAGFNSVVFDRNNGSLNETIVYSDDAIRPVFLIMFS